MSTSPRTASLLVLAPLLLGLAACGGSPDDATDQEPGPAAAEGVIDPGAVAVSRAQRLDEGLPFAAASVSDVETPDGETHQVRLWRRNDRVVKITASAPDETGRRTDHTEFYFENEQLFFVRDPDWRYVFSGGRLEMVLDHLLEPIVIDAGLLAGHERRLLERVEHYLAAHE